MSEISKKLDELNSWKKEIELEEADLILKGMSSTSATDVMAANRNLQDIAERQDVGLKSQFIDPNSWNVGQGYVYKRSNLSFNVLRRMAKQPIIRAIISTRQTQISAFSSPQRDKYDTGFVIRKKTPYYDSDKEIKYTKEEVQKRLAITEFIMNCGDESNKWFGDNFDQFLKKIVADSLELDQAAFEVKRNKKGNPRLFQSVDGATIYVADTLDDRVESDKARIKGYLPSHVQVIDGQVQADFYAWELCIGKRNMSTDIHSNGYGRSELEDLIQIVTYMLYSDAYNGKFFSNGSAPKGIMKIKGNVNRNRLMEFKQQWLSQMTGVENSWKMPVLEGDMDYIDLQKGNRDMEFSEWQKYLIRVACAVYKISPEECGFDLDSGGSGGITFESNNEQKLKYSKDKGLKPLLTSIEWWMNKWIVQPIDPNFEFVFVGLDADTEEKELDMLIKKVQNGMGYKEFRLALGLDENLKEGDFPLNSAYIQMQGQLNMMAQQQGDGDDEQKDDIDWESLGSDEQLDETIKAHVGNPMMEELLKLGIG